MKTKKLLLLVAGIFFFLLISGFTAGKLVDLYSTKKAEKLGRELANDAFRQHGKLNLGDLLYNNIHTQIKEDESAGNKTPAQYKNGWRKILAKNPKLAYSALNNYGPIMIKSFNREYTKIMKNGYLEGHDPLPQESLKKVWVVQKKRLNDYQLLAQKLLSLPDSTLNSFIKEITWEQEPYDGGNGHLAVRTQTWMLKNGLIEKLPNHNYNYGQWENSQIWYLGMYPLDLLTLTIRVNRDYPEWTPRKFLTEALRFSEAVEKILPKS